MQLLLRAAVVGKYALLTFSQVCSCWVLEVQTCLRCCAGARSSSSEDSSSEPFLPRGKPGSSCSSGSKLSFRAPACRMNRNQNRDLSIKSYLYSVKKYFSGSSCTSGSRMSFSLPACREAIHSCTFKALLSSFPKGKTFAPSHATSPPLPSGSRLSFSAPACKGSRVNQGLYRASSFLNKSLVTPCWVGELGSSCTSSCRLLFSAPACTKCLLSWYLNCMLWSTCSPRLPRPESEISQWIDLPDWAGVQESWPQAGFNDERSQRCIDPRHNLQWHWADCNPCFAAPLTPQLDANHEQMPPLTLHVAL